MASRADVYRGRALHCETRVTVATDLKIQTNLSGLARRWRELARQLDMQDDGYSPDS
jgi:hypothetical protein